MLGGVGMGTIAVLVPTAMKMMKRGVVKLWTK
jgi:hypothetical protein